jgi:hypothetical protein
VAHKLSVFPSTLGGGMWMEGVQLQYEAVRAEAAREVCRMAISMHGPKRLSEQLVGRVSIGAVRLEKANVCFMLFLAER